MRNVTIRQLQMFVGAAEAASFARAAEILHVSPAAVSFQIKQIEDMSGFALFERIGKSVALTDAGTTLLTYARIVLQALQDSDKALMSLRGVLGGRVTLGAVSTAKYIVPHVLARFQSAYPGISINLRFGNRQHIVDALDRGEIELAVMGQPGQDTEVVATEFAAHPSVIIAASDHRLAQAPSLAIRDLVAERIITREEGSGTRLLMEQACLAAGFTPRIGMTTDSNETIKQAVMAGMGIAVISRHTIGLELALGFLRTLPVDGFPVLRSWFVVRRRSMPMMPGHLHLRDFLVENGQSVIDDLEAGVSPGCSGRRRSGLEPGGDAVHIQGRGIRLGNAQGAREGTAPAIDAGRDNAGEPGGASTFQAVQRVLDGNAIFRRKTQSLQCQAVDVRCGFFGGHFVAGRNDGERVAWQCRLKQSLDIRQAGGGGDRKADIPARRRVKQRLDAGSQIDIAACDRFSVAPRLVRMQGCNLPGVEGRAGGVGGDEMGDALLAAGHFQQLGIQRLVPGPSKARRGKGFVESLAMKFFGLGQGSIDVEDQCAKSWHESSEESSSFLKKRTKKLLRPGVRCRKEPRQPEKVFCFFSSEKKTLPYLCARTCLRSRAGPENVRL